MRTYVARLKSTSPYSQSKHYKVPMLEKEDSIQYEERTWRERLHVDENGNIFIPPMAIKNCLSETGKFISMQIPGKGKSTYTKHIEAGLIVMDKITLPIKKDEVPGEWLFVPSDGVRGSGKRVLKCFPAINDWSGEVRIYVLDETITKNVLEKHLVEGGLFVGIGRFRPRRNGFYGRFQLLDLKEA